MSLLQSECSCLKLDSIAVWLRSKGFVSISDIGFVLVAPYDWLHLTSHFHQLLRVPEHNSQKLLL